ncbi:hypothetical protein [Liquorilactobacillus hordei]|nr:hypothetical protein [Liquorilactobacillus hordei]QYH51004.1 hypothetical protein G6O70_00115 [Liquorilactobacillus hordei DSM 19519]
MAKYINKKGQVLSIEADECAENPMREWGMFGTYYTFESRSFSPQEHKYSDSMEFLGSIIGDELVEKIHDKYSNTSDFLSDVLKRINKLGYIMFPISKFEHSNVVYSIGVSNGWDCGTVGLAFVTKEKLYKEFGKKRISSQVIERVKNIFESELNTYTQWCNGEVYGFTVSDSKGEVVDSCWGFYGLCQDTDLDEAVKSGLLETVAESTNCGEPSDWEEAKVDRVIYKAKTA